MQRVKPALVIAPVIVDRICAFGAPSLPCERWFSARGYCSMHSYHVQVPDFFMLAGVEDQLKATKYVHVLLLNSSVV